MNTLYLLGEGNVNQNIGIALFQNLFLRFHNLIADTLQAKHTMWPDETVYQETRRIVYSAVQVITYEQFLPLILGKNYKQYCINNNKFQMRFIYN